MEWIEMHTKRLRIRYKYYVYNTPTLLIIKLLANYFQLARLLLLPLLALIASVNFNLVFIGVDL